MKFPCPNCSNNIEAGPNWYGHETTCPHCQQSIMVPTPSVEQQGAALIFISTAQGQQGPYPLAQLISMVNEGTLSDGIPACQQGSSSWAPLKTFIPQPEPQAPPQVFQEPPQVAAQPPQLAQAPPLPHGAPVMNQPAAASQMNPHYANRAGPGGRWQVQEFDGPRGVGGWLMFFCIMLTVLGPVFSFIVTAVGWEGARPGFNRIRNLETALVWETVGTTVAVVVGVICGIVIWSGSRSGRSVARGFLIFHLIITIVMGIMSYSLLGKLVQGTVIFIVVREFIFFLIWWSYFQVSVRVRNTYDYYDA